MQLTEFLNYLESVKGHGNQYSARCPSHDDRHNSLSISRGQDGKILLKCQAGCSTSEIVNAMGLKMADLFSDKPEVQQKRHKVAEYLYVDTTGEVVHKKIRYEPKGFIQAKPDGKGGWVYNLKGIQPILYNLPAVVQGIQDGQPIYIVEGEKDVETLKKHKKIATCNTHGAGEGKWLSQYNKYLYNSIIIIIQDNDEIGKAFAEEIAESLWGKAKSVKLIDLTISWPELPEHGDISDVFTMVHNDAEVLKKLNEIIENTPNYISKSVPKVQPDSEYECDAEFKGLFSRSGYTAIDGNTNQVVLHKECNRWQVDYKPICNFVAWCTGEKTTDDGIETKKTFAIKGKHASGRELPEIEVQAADFNNMNWITKMWGFSCNLNPGTTIKDRLRHCIQQISRNLKSETVYTYTGWRLYREKWIYLHGKGAVGAKDIDVKLEGRLSNYHLPGENPDEYARAVKDSMKLFNVAPQHIIFPLLAFTFLSPLNEFLKQAGHEPKFVYFLMGKTGTGKSTLAALFLSFFGRFNNTDLPLSFMDTANAIVNQVFLCKDNVICIDDYKPSTRNDVNRMDNVAQNILRSYGERTGRNRLNSNSTLMKQRAPRGNAIFTGEQPPNVGESGTARFVVSELKTGDTDFTALTIAQDDARNEVYSLCMRAYIEWLKAKFIDNGAKKFVQSLANEFEETRNRFFKSLNELTHPRVVEALAHLCLGWKYFVKFASEYSAVDEQDAKELLYVMDIILLQMGKDHAELLNDDKPSKIFIDKLKVLIKSQAVYVHDATGGYPPPPESRVPFIGYFNKENYYFYSEIVYKQVVKFCTEQGEFFPVGQKTLLKHLAEDGIINVIAGDKTPRHIFNGKRGRFLTIDKSVIDEA
ncbi:MAG: DUF927 domain-containing protein [Bacillota bacterium]|nr:DUF927 domain-containing protein [Bacillota bacterium]